MSVKVVDASALGAIIFAEPEAEGVVRELSDNRLVAPSLIQYELASICLKKIHRYPSKANQLITAFEMADRLSIETFPVNHVEVIELAKHTRLTTYDSSYLWLAQKTGAKLVTLDKRLKKAIAKGSMAKG
jgi:predicted nucleic acid-binding protein